MEKKVITYVPSQVTSLVELYSKHLKTCYKTIDTGEINGDLYLVMIHKDLQDNLKDPQKFVNDYIEMMVKLDMPYAFFPYYTYFNKVLPDMVSKPNPRVELAIKDIGTYNIVNQICHGCFILNVNKLKSINFMFDKTLPIIYFLQDMIEKCYINNLWATNCWFIDRLNSWNDLKVVNNQGWTMNGENFNKQKQTYSSKGIQYHNVHQFVKNLKERLNKDTVIETETKQETQQ